MRKIRRQIYCWNGWQCDALSCDVSLILILPGPMWWWCCAVLSACWKTRVNTSAAALSLDQDCWTLQWMVLAANSFYLAIDPNMMLLNTILFIDTHHSLISPHTEVWCLRNIWRKQLAAELDIDPCSWHSLLPCLGEHLISCCIN